MEADQITLTWQEAAMASEVGRLRQLASIKAGRQDRHGFAGDGWDVHIEGACGELAVAKRLGVYWDGSIDNFGGPDIPGGLQVRTRSQHGYELLIRPGDSDTAVWVLVTGRCPNYRVRGWLRGSEARQPRWLKSHGNRPAAYFVPTSALHPIEALTAAQPLRA